MFKTMILILLCLIATVSASPTIPTIVGPTSGILGNYYTYTAKGAIDSDGYQIRYIFDWGDGTTTTSTLRASGTGITTQHKWIAQKTYALRVQAKNINGASSGWATMPVIIGPANSNKAPNIPTVPVGPNSGISGSSYSYSTSATDPDGNQVKYTFSWGDGTTSVTSLVNSGISASASHIWTVAAGSKAFSVTAMATDTFGLTSVASNPISVTVTAPVISNQPPARPSIPDGDLTGISGGATIYSTKATDPDGDKVKITFDWGDGTTSTTSLVSSGASASASHYWTVAPGTVQKFYIRAMATDEHGLSSAWCSSETIVILAPKPQNPPSVPSKPVCTIPLNSTSGKYEAVSGVSYNFSTSSTDADGDWISYMWDFGGGTAITDYYPSGRVVTVSYTWYIPAGKIYQRTVRAIASDSRNAMSNGSNGPYSDALNVFVRG